MPEIIITPSKLEEHKIEKYSFRSVDSKGLLSGEEEVVVTSKPQEFTLKKFDFSKPAEQLANEGEKQKEEAPQEKEEGDTNEDSTSDEDVEMQGALEIPQPAQESNQQNEELLKKIDELTSNVVKLEMELEKREEEYNESLEDEKTQAFNEGYEKGKIESSEESEKTNADYLRQLHSSISKLDQASKSYESGVKALEEELTTVALDIAKEVITKEMETNSEDIAKSLAYTLLSEVKDASEITLKVSPGDIESVKESITDPKIKIESDEAVNPGGVILLSDIGNINGDIHTRYEQLKKHSLEE